MGGALWEEQERRGGHLPCPLEPRKPAGLPGEVPCPLRPGVGGTPGPLLFLEPKPHPPTASRAFSSPVGAEHWPHPPPKPHTCLGPALHSQGLPPLFFFFSLLLFFTIVVLTYLPVVDSSIFLFLHSF